MNSRKHKMRNYLGNFLKYLSYKIDLKRAHIPYKEAMKNIHMSNLKPIVGMMFFIVSKKNKVK